MRFESSDRKSENIIPLITENWETYIKNQIYRGSALSKLLYNY